MYDRVPEGLSPYFQRNQSAPYNIALPWNTSYVVSGAWNGVAYTLPHGGNGYAYVTPTAGVGYNSSISTRAVSIQVGSGSGLGSGQYCPIGSSLNVSFAYTGQTVWNGAFTAQYSLQKDTGIDIDTGGDMEADEVWTSVLVTPLYPRAVDWVSSTSIIPLPDTDTDTTSSIGYNLKLKFTCASGVAVDNYCAIDTISVQC